MRNAKSLLVYLVAVLAITIASGQETVMDKIKKTADYQAAQVPKDTEAILRTQPPIAYEWGVLLGFGLGMAFTCTAQWLSDLRRDAKAHRQQKAADPFIK